MTRLFRRMVIATVLFFSSALSVSGYAVSAPVGVPDEGEPTASREVVTCKSTGVWDAGWYELESGNKDSHLKGDRRMTVTAYVEQFTCTDNTVNYMAKARIENYEFRGWNPRFQRDRQYTSVRGAHSWRSGVGHVTGGDIEISRDMTDDTVALSHRVEWKPGAPLTLVLDVEVSEDAIGSIPIHISFTTP